LQLFQVETYLSKDFERVHKVVVAFGTAFYKGSFMNMPIKRVCSQWFLSRDKCFIRPLIKIKLAFFEHFCSIFKRIRSA
jgi:hypothetical protein